MIVNMEAGGRTENNFTEKSIDKYFKLIYAKLMDILLDLYLASLNIGALWFGIEKVEEDTYNGLDFVIMIAIAKVTHYNRIDIGIFLAFLELCLEHEKSSFDRNLFVDNDDDSSEEVLVAEYSMR